MKRSHNDVDISQRTADPSPGPHDGEVESFIEWLKQFYPYGFHYPGGEAVPAYHHVWGDPESEERLRQVLSDNSKSTAERAEEQRTSDDYEFMKDPEKWNRSRKKL